MTIFSKQRYTRFFRSTTLLFCGLAISSLLVLGAHAQSKDELFRGTWQIDTPEKGTLIMIVKSQSQASYFWGDNTDRTVYSGTWASEGETATLIWADGSQHRIEGDSLGFAITHIDAGGREAYTTKAQQVPAEILGQWAKPPTKASEIASDRDQAKGFIGIWKIGEDETNANYIFVESDRSAATNAGGEDGLRGSWAKQGSELHITWDSGHYSILRPIKREFIYKMVEDVTGKDGLVFFPYIMTLFMFILVANFLGLLPMAFTTTSHIAVTAVMAMAVFLAVTIIGFVKNGFGFLAVFWISSAPLILRPILALIEIISYFVRPVSHSIRLAGNMMAGHAVIKVFAAFAPLVLISTGIGIVVTPLSILAITAIYALEVLVAFIQAYVFAILTCVYLRDALHPHH